MFDNEPPTEHVLKVIVDGWPDRQRALHSQLRPFWSYRGELVTDDGIILKGNRIVMLASLHAETLVKLREIPPGSREDASTCPLVRFLELDYS